MCIYKYINIYRYIYIYVYEYKIYKNKTNNFFFKVNRHLIGSVKTKVLTVFFDFTVFIHL